MGRFDAFNDYERAMCSSERAAAYESGLTRLTAHTVDALLDAAAARPGRHLLDVGTGPGLAAQAATRRGCTVVGIDVSPQMVELARVAVPGAEFREGSAESLPCADASFDAVVGNFVVLHLGHPDRLTAEAVRVLRPGGRAAFTVWATGDRNRILGIFPDVLAEAGVAAPDSIPDGPLSTDYADHDRFAALLGEAGFTDVVVSEVEWDFQVDPSVWWDAVVASTPRTGGLVSRQSVEVQDRLRATYDAMVERYVDNDGLATFPVVAVLARGVADGS